MTDTTRVPLTIADFMTPSPATVDEGLPLADAQERMFVNNIRHLVVTRGEILVTGVLSTRDVTLALSLSEGDGKKLRVVDAMTKDPYTCAPGTLLEDVAREMEAHRFGCALVMEDKRPIGMFTTTDALRALRQLIVGHPVEAAVQPTHLLASPAEREHVTRNVHARDALGRSNPSPNQGKVF